MQKNIASPTLNQLRSLLPGYAVLGIFSFFCPLLYLSGPIYSENIMDRVLLSRSEASLWFLFAVAFFLVVMYSALEFIRTKSLQRIGVAIDRRLTEIYFDKMHRFSSDGGQISNRALHDLNTVREFLSGHMIGALFDAFWSPIFIAALFVIHPVYGLFVTAMLLLTTALGIVNQIITTGDSKRYQSSLVDLTEFSSAVARNSDSIRALGMLPFLTSKWYKLHSLSLGWQIAGTRRASVISAVIKFVKNAQIIFVYTVGALLYLNNEINVSTMIIALVVVLRALGPIDVVISGWRSITNFRIAFRKVDEILAGSADGVQRLSLPAPSGPLLVSRLTATAPGRDEVLINDVSFSVEAGRVLGIVGPSGAGKSCLARLLVGIWRPRRGTVVFGNHDLSHWDEDQLGRHLGYVPQDVELLPGTIAENIMRFGTSEKDTPETLCVAAELAGIQDIIRGLPDGFNTRVGPRGHVLSGGQRQRIAFARAVYGNPALVVLDEPNSSLDAAGEQALANALERLRKAGSTVIVITHKVSLLSYCDDVLVLSDGTVQAHGARDQIFNRVPRLKATPSLAVIEGNSEGKRA